MKKFWILLALVLICHRASAQQLVLSNFSDLSDEAFSPFALSFNGGSPAANQYTQGSGFVSITSVNGGNPDGEGNFRAVLQGSTTSSFSSASIVGLTQLTLTARLDTGNLDTSFGVLVLDNTGTEIGSSTFLSNTLSSSFSTVSSAFVLNGGGNASQATFFQFVGDGVSGDSVRISLDNLAATSVPEPSSLGLGIFSVAAALLFYRRRSRGKIA